ncbi:hypothetical protein DPMN_119842 [Dreissena polymorpha]|uniref:Uncharacterized protein n=1 Tax=Dreissena polymorpha TaxID=45954 RepID=A0A9D4JN23_DREPO|nr:hypothetical protein DPMN_119842 [Dreissena polymorpha]
MGISGTLPVSEMELHQVPDTGFPPVYQSRCPRPLLYIRRDNPLPAKLPTCQSR